jgi:hypothetical protein
LPVPAESAARPPDGARIVANDSGRVPDNARPHASPVADGARPVEARNLTRGTALCTSLEVAESFGGRFMGLMPP